MHNSEESRNDENRNKASMSSRRGVGLMPRAHEKGNCKDPGSPYQEPAQVPLG